jgi:beta-N-acetylglucosaminidase
VAASDTYYNFFGIHAYDGVATRDGSQYAASQNWNSVRAAIFGGAYMIAKQYINSVDTVHGYDQNTLYEMRWDPYGDNRYAVDLDWASGVASIISDYSYLFNGKVVIFKIPTFN